MIEEGNIPLNSLEVAAIDLARRYSIPTDKAYLFLKQYEAHVEELADYKKPQDRLDYINLLLIEGNRFYPESRF